MSEDPERHLAFLVRARSVLYQSDDITAHILMLMVSFALQFYKNRPASNKKATFMRALIANLFITTPSINDPVVRLNFSLRTVYLTLLANSRPQTEALLHYSLQTLNDLDVSPAQCLSLYSQFLALLVFIPDKSKDYALSMFKGFVKKWPPNNEGVLGDVWILCLRYLWAVSRQEFSTKFTNVQSNDVFHGSSKAYRRKWPPNNEGVLGDVWILCLRYLWAVSRQEFSTKFTNVQSNDVFHGSSKAYRMFSDDDDFVEDLLSDIDSSPEKPNTTSEKERFYELMKRHEELQRRMNDVDELARQVKFAMELQKGMSDCYSNRVASFPIETNLELQKGMSDCYSNRVASFPIEANLELRCLASGSLLILFTIRNKTSCDLKEWTISASFSPTTSDNLSIGSLSRSMVLHTLAPGEEFSSELFVTQQHLRLPLLIRLNLVKNKTSCDLREWTISASFSPTTSNDLGIGSLSRSMVLHTLAPGEEFSSELFVAQQHLRLPLLIRLNLVNLDFSDVNVRILKSLSFFLYLIVAQPYALSMRILWEKEFSLIMIDKRDSP
ncbi:unnamed protein product [Strongylus vulgaris]|uniref:Uncharacterized protein n=1 Tax=Strongylus vulgaris TaxID=40348 RepID=A0A3P7JC47_STRVU|nr:unnamed protein product [Strongylus vulgaris]